MMIKRCLCLLMLILLTSGCSSSPSAIEDNFVILDAQVINVQKHYKSFTEITIKAQDKQYVLRSGYNSYDNQLIKMKKFGENTGTSDVLRYDITVTYDLYLKAIALSRARQH